MSDTAVTENRTAVFILPAADYAALEKLAASEERSVSAELRLAVRAYLRAKEQGTA